MSYVITGATGHLGWLVVRDLLRQGVPGRDITKVKDLADRGVRVLAIDYDDPASLDAAFRGADRVLLISASEPGRRAEQHGNAIDAAARSGAGLLAYTSIANAGTTTMRLAAEHQVTEAALRGSGLNYALLRNSWYFENYTAQIPAILQRGSLAGSAGDGRVSAATRADYAAAAAAVLAGDGHESPGDGHEGRAYELGAQAGQPVSYLDLPEDEYARVLTGAGLPEAAAVTLADADRGLARGDLFVDSGDLSRLIERPATTLREAVAGA